MRKNHIFIIASFLLLSGCKKEPSQFKELEPNIPYDNVYLIMGQSNASGCSPHSFLEATNPEVHAKYSVGNEKVQITYDVVHQIENNFVNTKFGQGDNQDYFGPEIGIAESLSEFEETSYIVKATLSGSCLQTQYVDKNGKKYDYYNRFVTFIKDQVTKLQNEGKNPRIRGVFWMQGESDSSNQLCGTYEIAQQKFYNYLIEDLNPWIYDHFNFVDAYISTKSKHWPNPTEVNRQKQNFADKNKDCYCIKTNGEDDTAISLNLKFEMGEGEDYAHYDSRSMLLLGKTAGNYLKK